MLVRFVDGRRDLFEYVHRPVERQALLFGEHVAERAAVQVFHHEISDALLVCGVVGRPLRLEGSRPVLKELFLPAVEHRRLESLLAAQFRDRHLLKQMPPQDGDLLFWRVVLPLLLHALSPLPYWENAFLHFQLNRNTVMKGCFKIWSEDLA